MSTRVNKCTSAIIIIIITNILHVSYACTTKLNMRLNALASK